MNLKRRDFAKILPIAALVQVRPGAGLPGQGASAKIDHPVFKPGIAATRADDLRARLRTLSGMDEASLLQLIPSRTGFLSVDCPNCHRGSQGMALRWRIEEPAVLTCSYCGERYPTRKYPDDKVLLVKDPLGGMQEYPYYSNDVGKKHFFQARLWRLVRDYLERATYDLAVLYYLSGEKEPARKVALILDRFAQFYPGFIVVRESSFENQGFQEHPPYETQGGKWGRWYYDEMPTSLIQAYDLIYTSGELEKLSAERHLDARRRIEEDFFRGAVRHVRAYPEFYGNPSPRIYEGLAVLGRVLGDPDYVHDAVRRMKGLFERRFFFDGFWAEGSYAYHDMTMRGMRAAMDAAGHYSDPPGYVDPADGKHFDDLNLETEIPMLARAQKTMERFRFPDGRPLPVHDSWARFRGAYVKLAPLSASSPALWAGMGHAYLGRGKDADQIQVHLHFAGGYGHAHNDNLTLGLWACGEELLPDIGYSHTRYRMWTLSTLGHNTVVVNSREQHVGSAAKPSDGNLQLFGAAGEHFQILEASGERAYPEQVSRYRRTVMLVGIDEKNAYVVDLFQVAGGQRHEWVLHGSADRDQELEVEAPLSENDDTLLTPGVKFVPPETEEQAGTAEGLDPAYGLVRQVRRAVAPPVVAATFRPAAGAGASLRIHCISPSGTEVLTGSAPSIRRADEDNATLDQFRMPMLLLRSDGENLAGTFVSVLEPFRTSPLIRSVKNVEVRGGGMGLVVSGDGWTDHIIYRPETDAETEARAGDLRLKGKVGWVRERHGSVASMCLVAGTHLRYGKRELKSDGTLSGRVKRVWRKAAGDSVDALEVEGSFPPAASVEGLTAIVHHGDGSTHGYPLLGLRREGAHILLILAGEPGFEIDQDGGTRFFFFPLRLIEGEVTCFVPLLVYS